MYEAEMLHTTPLAQSVERTPFKRVVEGSSPSWGGGQGRRPAFVSEVPTGKWRNINHVLPII